MESALDTKNKGKANAKRAKFTGACRRNESPQDNSACLPSQTEPATTTKSVAATFRRKILQHGQNGHKETDNAQLLSGRLNSAGDQSPTPSRATVAA